MKTRTYIYGILAPVVAAVLLSCNRDSGMEVQLGIASVTPEQLSAKSVISGDEFPEGSGIGLSLFKDSGAEEPYGTGNVRYALGESGWTADQPIVMSDGTAGYLYGYYPYAAGTDIREIAVSSSVGGDDVMYAAQQDPVEPAEASSVKLTMKHALSFIGVKVRKGSYIGSGQLTALSLEGDGIACSGTLDAVTGVITPGSTETFACSPDVGIDAAGKVFECLIVPAVVSDARQTVTFGCTIDGVKKSLKLEGDNGVKVASGIASTITITVNDNGLEVSSGTLPGFSGETW